MPTPISDPKCPGCLGRGVATPADHAELVCVPLSSEFVSTVLVPNREDQAILEYTQWRMIDGQPAEDVPL